MIAVTLLFIEQRNSENEKQDNVPTYFNAGDTGWM